MDWGCVRNVNLRGLPPQATESDTLEVVPVICALLNFPDKTGYIIGGASAK